MVNSNLPLTSIDSVSKLEDLVNGINGTKTIVPLANTEINIVAPTSSGTYKLVVVDSVGNISTPSINVVTVSVPTTNLYLRRDQTGSTERILLYITANKSLHAATFSINLGEAFKATTLDYYSSLLTTGYHKQYWKNLGNEAIENNGNIITLTNIDLEIGETLLFQFDNKTLPSIGEYNITVTADSNPSQSIDL